MALSLPQPLWLINSSSLVEKAHLSLVVPSFLESFFFMWTALGLCCCVRAFSSCGEQGLLFVVVRRLLIAVASLVAEWALGTWASVVAARRLSSCGAWA